RARQRDEPPRRGDYAPVPGLIVPAVHPLTVQSLAPHVPHSLVRQTAASGTRNQAVSVCRRLASILRTNARPLEAPWRPVPTASTNPSSAAVVDSSTWTHLPSRPLPLPP